MYILNNEEKSQYSVKDCKNTITIGELIEFLSEFNKDEKIVFSFNGGYMFKSVTIDTFLPDCEVE